ncbi:MAG: GIY-YIG nuclease family protein [Methanobrevibacter sp.]|nr:GIY-YIG nuclease family protein [Candidatus Methanovirga aequatorialis]
MNYWQELYKEKSLNLANEKQILQMIEKEKETSDGDEILENLPELKFIKYCDFISECRYDGKAVYILYFIDNKKFYVGQTRTLLSRQKNHID